MSIYWFFGSFVLFSGQTLINASFFSPMALAPSFSFWIEFSLISCSDSHLSLSAGHRTESTKTYCSFMQPLSLSNWQTHSLGRNMLLTLL